MKVQLLLTSLALSAATAITIASENGSTSGYHPVVDTGGDVAASMVRNLDSRRENRGSERYQTAKPMPLPKLDQSFLQPMLKESDSPEEEDATGNHSRVSEPGHAPVLEKSVLESLEQQLYQPPPAPSEAIERGAAATVQTRPIREGVAPMDVGFRRAYFSSQPLVPVEADRSYPYSAVGVLFFHVPGEGDFVCSAAAVSLRLVMTAGHCVHSGSGNEQGWYTDFEFVPAYRDGVAPFGTWKGSAAFVSTPWYNGRGNVPNIADYALIQVEDQVIDGVSRRIGEAVGYFGFKTNYLFPNHAHLLGYPAVFDGGERMHQVTAASFRRSTNNTVLYGSDMTEGSSGGPWIMNFGDPSSGQTGFDEPERNQVIGVTSYGYSSGTRPVEGSSTLDENFVSMRNTACARQTGNCP